LIVAHRTQLLHLLDHLFHGHCGLVGFHQQVLKFIDVMTDYGNPNYWDERYAADSHGAFDWYQPYLTLKMHLMPMLSVRPDFEILIPGCGNSPLGACLFNDGYKNITSVDISTVVIKQMAARHAATPELEFLPADMTNLDGVPNEAFDLVIDKALLDSMLCGDESFDKAMLMLAESYRVLKPGGKYVVVSYGVPSSRVALLEEGLSWTVEVVEIPKPPVEEFVGVETDKCHYMYICTKSSL
jgi:SAM-dependent methyltransferase|tara:strand:+ start:2151 stop:2873 length:723 start_codon:yes stop_codon:yes gene_type:complete